MRIKIGCRQIITAVLFFLLTLNGWTQSNLIFYNSGDQINAPDQNPAFLTSQHKFTFSIFPISGFSVGYNNQQVINDMLFNVVRGNQTKEQFKEVFRSMLKLGLFYQRMEIPLFNFGYNSKIGSFNFRIKDNMRLMTNLKGEVSDFLSDYNTLSVTLNQPQTFPVHAMYYREYSLGYAKEIVKNKLSIGVRAKAYFGKFSLISDVQGVASLRPDNNYYFQTSKQLKLSFPATIIRDNEGNLSSINAANNFSIGNFLFNSKNSGLGFDIGLNYKINSEFEISASVTDIGKINWKSDLNSMDYVGEYQFEPGFVNSAESNSQRLTRSKDYPAATNDIPQLFKIDLNHSAYSTSMPMTIFAALQYKVNADLKFGIVNRYIRLDNLSYNSISLTGDFRLKKNLNLITGYSVQGNSFVNLPLAIVYNWPGGQYFIGTDNCLSYLLPKISDYSGVSLGACIYLFNKKANNKKTIDYLPFFEWKKRKSIS